MPSLRRAQELFSFQNRIQIRKRIARKIGLRLVVKLVGIEKPKRRHVGIGRQLLLPVCCTVKAPIGGAARGMTPRPATAPARPLAANMALWSIVTSIRGAITGRDAA
jgi:hypothetical protein